MRNDGPAILLVEDSPDDVKLIIRAFSKTRLPKRVEVVRDGAEALAYLFGKEPYADRGAYPLPVLIILDLKMPRVDGFDVLATIKQAPHLRRIPIVVLTSSSETADVDRCYDLGANSYLVKPGSWEGFTRVVAEIESYWLTLNVTAPIEALAG